MLGPSLTRIPTALRTSLCRQAHFVVDEEDELWVASGIDGTLTEWRSEDGVVEPRRSIALAPPGVPLPDSTRAQLVSRLPRQFDPEAGDLYNPSDLSSICGLELSAGGTLWVRLGDVSDVATLRPTQELTALDGVRMSAYSEEMAYGIWVDEAGAPNVMVYRIE